MSYVNKRTRLFMDRGDRKPERRRSEARLKTYPSAIDIRAWCAIVEDRRQHILELMTKGREKCLGKLIPLEAIIDALLSSYKADISKLKRCLAQLWQFIDSISLSGPDNERLLTMKRGMEPICTGADKFDDECVAKDRHKKELAEINDLTKPGGGAGGAGGSYKVTTRGPARITTKVKGIRPGGGQVGTGKSSGAITTRAQGSRVRTCINEACPKAIQQNLVASNAPPLVLEHMTVNDGQLPIEALRKQRLSVFNDLPFATEPYVPPLASSTVFPQKEMEVNNWEAKLAARENLCNELQVSMENLRNERDQFKNQLNNCLQELEAIKLANAVGDMAIPASCKEEIDALELEIKVMRSGNLSPEQEAAVIKKEVDVLRRYCMKLKSVEDENERLKIERDSLRNQVAKPIVQDEIGQYGMGTDYLSSRVPPTITAKCPGVRSQGSISDYEDNEKRKMEKDILNRQVAISAGDDGIDEVVTRKRRYDRGTTQAPMIVSEEGTEISSFDRDMLDIPHIEELNSKLRKLEDITRERDLLANKVQKLEKELLQYRDLPEDIDVYRNRSKMLDSALEERDKMMKKVDQIKELEDELNQLRKRAARVDELEEELKLYNKNGINTGIELRKAKSKCCCLEKELQNVKMERDSMKRRIDCMKDEIETLKSKSRETEILKLERDRLQIRLNELSHMQVQHENLLLKCKGLESADAEKDMYKLKYEEIVAMQSQCETLRSQADAANEMARERDALIKQVGDLESCIGDQEEEIKKLVAQIDHLMRTKDETQSRMKEALSHMRTEVEKKDYLIAASEEKLAAVQTQLKSSIQGVSCETTCYKTRIDDLERELSQSQAQIEDLQIQLNEKNTSLKGVRKLTKCEYESMAAMKREIEAARIENQKLREIANKMVALTGDEHVKTMLQQSECAVKRVVEELGKQYEEWDHIKNRNQRGIFAHVNKNSYQTEKRVEFCEYTDSDESENLKDELEDIQREKEKLEQLVQQIQSDKSSDAAQDELACLRIDYENLKTQLEREIKIRKDLEKQLKK